jgi:DNA-directed RNA polymerase specialized sigma24 family protein
MATAPLTVVVRQLYRISSSDTTERTDAELLALFAADHRPDAFETLVRRYASLVLGVCRRVLGNSCDIDDVFQATFLVLARKATGIRKQDSVGSWLHGV